RMYQAVLPLRGKVLNVEKARMEKLLKNAEIAALIAAVGVDIDNVEDIAKVRYGKVIILTDADVDGQHIRTLLLTFFYRQMRNLVGGGHVFLARAALDKVAHGQLLVGRPAAVQGDAEEERPLRADGRGDAQGADGPRPPGHAADPR